MKTASRRGCLARLILALVSLVITVILLEAGLRLAGYRPPDLLTAEARKTYRIAPHGSFVYRGYLEGMFSDFANPVQLNGLAFHDVEHATERGKADTYRLMVVGDSYVAALSCPLETVFHRRLEQRLQQGNPFGRSGYEVLAFGQGNQAQEKERGYLEQFGPVYRPDAVLLLFFCGNDVMENSPETFAAAGAFARTYQKTVGPKKLQVYNRVRILPRSRLNGLVAVAATQFYANHLDWFVDGVKRDDLISPELGVYRVPLAPEWERAYARTGDLLAQMKAEAARQGVPFLIAGLSGPQAIGDLGGQQVASGKAAGLDFSQPERWLAGWCGSNQVPYLALEPALAAAGKRKVFWPHDGHLTPAGNEAIVEPLYRFVTEHAKPR